MNQTTKATILIVDDEPSNCLLLERVLGKLNCDIVVANNGWKAIEQTKERQFALILLDILMPEINGYETLVRIKSSSLNKDTPVFFMTGMETDQELLIKAYKAGAVDFIQKPMNLNILQRKTKYFLDYFNQNQELELARIESEKLMKTRMALVANITHELRTPLFAMLGMIDVLKQEKLTTTQMQLVGKISSNSENLLETVNEFLDFSKTEMSGRTIENEYFSLKKVCEDLLDLMNFQFQKSKDVKLDLIYDKEIPEFVRADKKKIRHILLNLFSNALKFTSIGSVKLEIRYIGIKLGKPIVKFIIEDSGLGIPEDKLESIFEEYTQVDNEAQNFAVGTGLGLTICNNLVRVLGGKLKVSSVEGEGTKFSFSIPIERGLESDIKEIKESYSLGEIIGRNDVKIIIVDDVADNLFVLKNYLKNPRITLDLCQNSEEGLLRLKENTYDIALLDINMPGKTGFEVASEYSEYCQAVGKDKATLIALTAFSMNDNFRMKIDTAGFSDHIMKPVRKEHLYKKIVSIVHNLESEGQTKIANIKDDNPSELVDYDFDFLGEDFQEYLPTYISNKEKEINELLISLGERDTTSAAGICHKILGTTRSFGLFKLDREIEEIQNLLKDDLDLNTEKINVLAKSSFEHISILKNKYPIKA